MSGIWIYWTRSWYQFALQLVYVAWQYTRNVFITFSSVSSSSSCTYTYDACNELPTAKLLYKCVESENSLSRIFSLILVVALIGRVFTVTEVARFRIYNNFLYPLCIGKGKLGYVEKYVSCRWWKCNYYRLLCLLYLTAEKTPKSVPQKKENYEKEKKYIIYKALE